MKIDVIDCRGFIKTPPYQDKVSGQGCVKGIHKSRGLGVQPLKPLKGVKCNVYLD